MGAEQTVLTCADPGARMPIGVSRFFFLSAYASKLSKYDLNLIDFHTYGKLRAQLNKRSHPPIND